MDNSSKSKWQVRAAVMIIFIIGFIAGAISISIYRSKHSPSGPGGIWSRHDQMIERLNLTAEQESQVETIFSDARAQLMEIRKESEPKFREVRAQTDARLQNALTPEQWSQFQQMVTEFRDKGRHGRGRHDGGRKETQP